MNWLEISALLAVVTYTVFLAGNMFSARSRSKKLGVNAAQPLSGRVSIVVPARNEAANIVNCLQSISEQDFPAGRFEVILVNDHSGDSTIELAENFLQQSRLNYKIVFLADNENGKKAALQKGISISSGEWIITRDADAVSRSRQWLQEMVLAAEQQGYDMLIAPVLLEGSDDFAAAFQKYENLAITLLGTGMARNNLPVVCSGANLAYKKDLFLELDPYRKNAKVASGDDMFVLKKAYAARKRIGVVAAPASVVHTPVEEGARNAFLQRLRWAAKTPRVLTLPIFFSGLILLLGNLGALVALAGILVDGSYLGFGLFTLTIKLIIDFLLLFLSARMFNAKLSLTWYLPAFLLNLLYTPAVAVLAVFVKPAWKGRST